MAASQGRAATRVAAGILLTRILGFVRQRVFAHYFGNSEFADAFYAALRIPNVIRNLLGEGTLSASFIPVYAGLLERGDEIGARRVAGTVASLLVLAAAVAAGLGILLAPIITDVVAPGFAGATRDLTVRLVEIMFPMAAIMILAAWCLGVLSTHARFFLTYAAPSLWNVAQIATLVTFGSMLFGVRLIVALAFGALAGSVLQLMVQLPAALRLTGRLRWSLRARDPDVRRVLVAWGPVVIGAGVVQISGVIDTQLASLLGTGAVAVLGYAQMLTLLPISLFGMSVAAAALPDLSREVAGARNDQLAEQIGIGLRRILFFVAPSAFVYAACGGLIVGTLFETGQFTATDTAVTAGVLAAYAIGLPAQASVRLIASGFYALGDTRTPVRIAALTVALSAGLAASAMQVFGVAGIALGTAAASYVNVGLLLRGLSRRLGPISLDPAARIPGAVLAGLVGATALTLAVGTLAAPLPRLPETLVALLVFGVVYVGAAAALGHPEARELLRRARLRQGGDR
jgi:putative peptidoglycan lipid II flippase